MPVKKEASSKKATKIKKSVVGNIQTVVVKVGETKKRKRAPRKPRKKPDSGYDVPTRVLPPVVYQIPQMGASSGAFDSGTPALFRPPPPPTGITIATQTKVENPILEDIGQVGTEGRVEILSLPSRSETLADLTTPVPVPSSPILQPPKPTFPIAPILQPSRTRQTSPKPTARNTSPQFGMTDVYDQPETQTMVSAKTARKKTTLSIATPAVRDPRQQSIMGMFKPASNPVFNAPPPEKGLLQGVKPANLTPEEEQNFASAEIYNAVTAQMQPGEKISFDVPLPAKSTSAERTASARAKTPSRTPTKVRESIDVLNTKEAQKLEKEAQRNEKQRQKELKKLEKKALLRQKESEKSAYLPRSASATPSAGVFA